MNMRLMVGGWDILPVGTKQGGEVCLSHIAEVLCSVEMTLLFPKFLCFADRASQYNLSNLPT
jgi:hypothetical protein